MPSIRTLGLVILLFFVAKVSLGQDGNGKQGLDSKPTNELFAILEQLSETRKYSAEAVLIELIGRPENEVGELLAQKLEQRVKRWPQERARLKQLEDDDVDGEQWRRQYWLVESLQNNLEMLTALRRCQEQPDPLAIEIKKPGDVIHGKTRDLPQIEVALKTQTSTRSRFVWHWVATIAAAGRHGGESTCGLRREDCFPFCQEEV